MIAYSRILKTERAGYLVRQYLRSNLYDRISTRPFLENIEKLWITYQLLRGLEQCHERKVYHGDIKSENVLVTSWNWVYISDFAPYKPAYLPENDPAAFSFFFDTSQRRSCYVAPERFLSSGEGEINQGKLTESMDIFSLGCVIAELFLEGSAIFTLAQLYKYKKGEYTPSLSDIEDVSVRELVESMISLDPQDRLSASEYLKKYKNRIFPSYFYGFLHDYISSLIDSNDNKSSQELPYKTQESDNRIEQVWNDFHKISQKLGFYDGSTNEDDEKVHSCAKVGSNFIPVCLDLPGMAHWVPTLRKLSPNDDDGALMMVAVVCSAIRNTSRANARVKGCELLLAFGERIHDEAKLDRCLSHLIYLLDDPSDLVQVAALRNLTHLLDLVGAITPINGNIFPEYILPRLYYLLGRSSVVVRAAYASCISSLAQTASRFLDMGQVLKTTGIMEAEDPETENGVSTDTAAYDTLKQNLSFIIEEHITALLTDSSSAVRRALLKNLVPLCMFFGKQKTNDVILSHLITYLNDRDPFLRIQLFDSIVGLAPYVGVMSLEQYIIPLMTQTLADPEEFVVEKVLQAFTALSDLGLIRASCTWELLKICAKFTIHPNTWIRNSTFVFFASVTRWLSPAQLYCIYLPILRPYLECEVSDFSESNLINNAKAPLSRAIYNRALTWAAKAQKSLFWKIDSNKANNSQLSLKSSSNFSTRQQQGNNKKRSGFPVSTSNEDDQWLERLREIGLKQENTWMLVTFREYIYRVARLNYRLSFEYSTDDAPPSHVPVQSIGVLPMNVFFDRAFTNNNNNLPRNRDVQKQQRQQTNANGRVLENGKKSGGVQNMGSNSTLRSGNNPDSSSHEETPSDAMRLLGLNSEHENNDDSPTSNVNGGMAAAPSTAMYLEAAYGEVGRDTPINNMSPKPNENEEGMRAFSSYTGDNPFIWKYLESVYYETLPNDFPPEYGKRHIYSNNTNLHTSQSANNQTGPPKRRKGAPLGILVSNFEEHNAAINSVVVSPDHSFFLTGSDDGSIKVWDGFRLEKNVINKSVQTYQHKDGIKVKKICFLESTYTFACSTNDGVIKLLRVDVTPRTENLGPRYRKLSVISTFSGLNEGEYALHMEHVKTEPAGSVLYVLTTASRVVAINLLSMEIDHVMTIPFSHGLPTCFVVDKDKSWLLVGTSYGILDLWDLRFALMVKSWGAGGSTAIQKLLLHPKSTGKHVCVVGGTSQPEVTVWDIETSECREIYRANDSTDTGKQYKAASTESVISAKANSILATKPDESSVEDEGVAPEILCAIGGADFEYNNSSSSKKGGYMITGGSDRMLRFWDFQSPESCSIISGLKFDSGKPIYSVLNPQPSMKLITEKISTGGGSGHHGHSKSRSSKLERIPRTTIMAADQMDLGRNHQAAIMDVAVILQPYEMIISVDRKGAVKVYM